MELTNKVRDRVIVFNDGSSKFITREQEEMLFSPAVVNYGSARIDGDYINLKSISRVISIEDYYSQFPAKRPAAEYSEFDHKAFSEIRKGRVRKSALESMIEGMKKYIASDRYQGTSKPLELLKMMESRLLSLE